MSYFQMRREQSEVLPEEMTEAPIIPVARPVPEKFRRALGNQLPPPPVDQEQETHDKLFGSKEQEEEDAAALEQVSGYSEKDEDFLTGTDTEGDPLLDMGQDHSSVAPASKESMDYLTNPNWSPKKKVKYGVRSVQRKSIRTDSSITSF